MDTTDATDTAATVIIGQKVRAGSEQAFEAWQKEMNREAAEVSRVSSPPRSTRRPRCNPSGWSSSASTRSRMSRRGSTARHVRSASTPVSSSSTGPAPSRSSAAARGRTIPWSPSWSAHRVTVGERRRVPRLAGSTSSGGEQVSRLPRHRAVSPCRGHPGGVDRPVPLRHRRRSRQVADLGRAQGASRRGREVRRLPPPHHRQLVRQLVRLRRARQPRRRHRRRLQDLHRGLGRRLYPTVVMLTLALSPLKMPLWLGLLDRKPVVQLRDELLRRCRTTSIRC